MKNRYRVFGHTTVNVTIEVDANSEDEAYAAAMEECGCLTAFCGNGGTDKLIGVDGSDESVDIVESIEYDDIELLGPSEDDDEEDGDDEC